MALSVTSMGAVAVVKTVEATIAEQRARLPPAATCEDPVEGLWKSHQYSPRWQDWTIFMLEVRRIPGSDTQLTGRIINHSWYAGPEEQEPGPCRGRPRWIVSMDARGHITEDRIFFGGVGQWRLDQVLCSRGPTRYNLDNFSGTIDFTIQEFQSVNNDGGRAVNEPTVFRRVRCLEPPPQPHAAVQPPPFYPAARSGGCDGP